MLYALLLLIIAILLFGSSAVIGALGVVLGFICATAALFVAMYFSAPWLVSLGLNIDQVGPAIILILVGLLVIARLAVYLIERRK